MRCHSQHRFPNPALYLSLLVSIATTASAFGQSLAVGRDTERRIQERTYHFEDAGRDIGYSLFVPSSYDDAKAHPLIVALHGLGSTAQQMIRYRGLTDLAESHGYVVVAPQGYNNHGWYGSLGPGINRFSERFSTPSQPDPENLGELSEKDVLNVLGIVKGEFNIDSDRVCLMGHSMGGGGTLYLGMKHASQWAALAPIAPAIYSSPSQLESIRNMPIIVVQGDEDRLVKVEVTRTWIEEMKRLGMRHEYIEIAGGDHVRVAAQNLPAIIAFFNQYGDRTP